MNQLTLQQHQQLQDKEALEQLEPPSHCYSLAVTQRYSFRKELGEDHT